jgi:DNA-binding MarR family transcriptional regulator
MSAEQPETASATKPDAAADTGSGDVPGQHPAQGLDETVHQRARLGILTVLSEVAECTFTTMRDELGLTDGNLSRHVRILEEAGLLSVHKGYDGRRPCTSLRLTRQGRRALRSEMAALERLVTRFRFAPTADEDAS